VTDLKRCDRCGYGGQVNHFENLDVMAYTVQPENADHATYVHAGRKAEITPDLVDLCQECRHDLRDFFLNVRIEPRHRS